MAKSEGRLPDPFCVKDCALAAIATGSKAQTLGEFRDCLKTVPVESVYYHFWRQSIEASLVQGSFFNDFSHWAHYSLHDDVLAERLALLDPSEYADLEKLREDVLEVVENRIDEEDAVPAVLRADSFHFIRSKIVVFNTTLRIEEPKELVKTLPLLSRSSIFYHVIDARRREVVGLDDFSSYLLGFGKEYEALIESFKQIDPYFITLSDLQKRLCSVVNEYFLSSMKDV